jgi:RNA polymerase sporulation-specific sigma factor
MMRTLQKKVKKKKNATRDSVERRGIATRKSVTRKSTTTSTLITRKPTIKKKNSRKIPTQKNTETKHGNKRKQAEPITVKKEKTKDACKRENKRQRTKKPVQKHTAVESVSHGAATCFEILIVDDPLVGTPKDVQIELDALALHLQKHPGDEACFNKIHYYIHNYLLMLVFKKYNFIKGYEENDMYQEALIALFKKAIPKFNPKRGMSFLNFAKMCINRHLITILHASKHRKKDIPMNSAISMDMPIHSHGDENSDASSSLSNVIADDVHKTMPFKTMVDREKIANTVKIISSRLSHIENVVLEEYLHERSYKEVAKNISKKLSIRFNTKSVDNALLRIRKKAEQILSDRGRENFPLLF